MSSAQLQEEKQYKKNKAVRERNEKHLEIKRLIPTSFMRNYNPLILFDEYTVQPPAKINTTSLHGVEVLFYIIDGELEYSDDLGQKNKVVESGAIQKITGGRGMQFKQSIVRNGANVFLGLCTALPEEDKDMEPHYQQLNASDITYNENENYLLKTLTGTEAAMQSNSGIAVKDAYLKNEGSEIRFDLKEQKGFIYVLIGEVHLLGTNISEGESIFFENYEDIEVRSKEAQSRFILVAGNELDRDSSDIPNPEFF